MYPFKSEWTARHFAIRALNLRDMGNPKDRKLGERYKRAAKYLYSRINRNTPW